MRLLDVWDSRCFSVFDRFRNACFARLDLAQSCSPWRGFCRMAPRAASLLRLHTAASTVSDYLCLPGMLVVARFLSQTFSGPRLPVLRCR